ncbi:MAG: glycosyltransferase family 2 protein [Chitinophagales bacterium]
MTPLSVVIITFNEEKNIGKCLDSVAEVADEIVVVDGFSTDRTKEICESYSVRFVKHIFEGHKEQKNYAVSLSAHQLVLSLDADECLSPELQQSILSVKNNWQHDGYFMNRLTCFCGQWVHHSGWYPDRKLRLFNKSKGAFGGTNPHDKFELLPKTSSGWISGDLLHYTAESESAYREKMKRYAAIAADAMYLQKRKINLLMLYVKTIAAFLRNYVIRFGFLDGATGWKVCSISAGYTYQKYEALRRLNKKNRSQ